MPHSTYRFGKPRSTRPDQAGDAARDPGAGALLRHVQLPGPRADQEPRASWARTFVQLRIELIQGERVETLGITEVPRNWDPVFDPRPKRDSLALALTTERLAHFQPGPALVRATARGSMQSLREPPPPVRERTVMIERVP